MGSQPAPRLPAHVYYSYCFLPYSREDNSNVHRRRTVDRERSASEIVSYRTGVKYACARIHCTCLIYYRISAAHRCAARHSRRCAMLRRCRAASRGTCAALRCFAGNLFMQSVCKLECGPMPNLMVALPNRGGANRGGALCSTPQSLHDAHY